MECQVKLLCNNITGDWFYESGYFLSKVIHTDTKMVKCHLCKRNTCHVCALFPGYTTDNPKIECLSCCYEETTK